MAYRVTLANRDRTFPAGQDETILEAAERAGLTLPAGCRSGRCITCAARLLAGRVDDSAGQALRPVQRNRGYVLLCVARARSDLVLEVSAESQRNLFDHPFRSGSSPPSGSP